MSSKDTEPAFPLPAVWDERRGEYSSYGADGLTAREYAAIHLRVPDSGSEWLDRMIRKARAADVEQAALQGLIANKANPLHFLPEDDAAYVRGIAKVMAGEQP